jgi:hypothetical protein
MGAYWEMNKISILTSRERTSKSGVQSNIALQLVDIQQRRIPLEELLTALRENRRGKGLYLEPTDRQVMEIWGQVDVFQSAIASWCMSSLTFAQTKSDAPTAGLQKLSVRVETIRPAPQMVASDQ